MGLKGFVVLLVIGIFGKDRSAGRRLHVNGHILGALLPKRWVIILVLWDDQNPNDINKWDTHHATYTGQKVLHLVKDLRGGGSVKGQGGILGLLLLGSPFDLVTLLLLQEAYRPLKFYTHKCL